MKLKIKHILPLLLLLISIGSYGQQIAIKSNGLYWLATTPNVGFELVTGEQTSLDLSLAMTSKVWANDCKMVVLQPEWRYWFNGRPMVREYIGIAALGANYDITWGNHTYDGDAFGAGVTMGYALPLGKRLNIEFYVGFGAVYFRQKQYYVDDNYSDFIENEALQVNSSGYKLIPIKLGVSISYIIK